MNGRRFPRFDLKKSPFFYSILLICLAYATFTLLNISRWVIAVDEFVFARQIYDYTMFLPYRDFPPYKGVIGYYLLSIPMYFSSALLKPLFYIKYEVVLINTGCLLLLSFLATQLFPKRPILLALLAVLTNQLFLIFAADLRVDMLATWGALFATFFVLQNRLRLGGALLGLAFLTSQKVLWYFFAINGAMSLCWILFSSSSRYSWRTLLTFNTFIALPIIIYVLGWATVSDLKTVLHSLFYEAYVQAGIHWYVDIYLTCWLIILRHGALLFFLWPLTYLSLFEKTTYSSAFEQRVFIISLASIVLIAFINYKQPFTYNFVFTVPAFFFLYANFLSWLDEKNREPNIDNQSLPSMFFIATMAVYLFGIYFLIQFFALSAINYLIMLFPCLMGLFLYPINQKIRTITFNTMITIFVITGILHPLYVTLKTNRADDGRYQQAMITLTAKLLENEGDYISGVPYLYQKDQPIDGLKNLISPALGYLSLHDEKLKPLLLPSLYLTVEATPEKIKMDLENSNVKVFISNYRTQLLPPLILNYFTQNYQHFYGSIYLYAPQILPKQLSFHLKFTGSYRVQTTKKSQVMIDGKTVRPNQRLILKKGDHLTEATQSYRLILIPDVSLADFDPAFQRDLWEANYAKSKQFTAA